MSYNRLTEFLKTKNTAEQTKKESISDIKFLRNTGDDSQPSDIRLVLDDIEQINRKNSLIQQTGAPQSNFAPFGTVLASESSSNYQPNVDAPPRQNPLHDFEPINYILSLSCISSTDFNTNGNASEILIAKSGGKGRQGAGVLGNDYYIDNLVVLNTVSPTNEGKSGSVYQVSFEVTEPFGTSFIDALITAAKSLGYDNHLKAVYKLNIEFKGVNDAGSPASEPVGFSSRTIPIHIYAVEMRVEAGVTTYQLQCVPATYLGLTEVHGVTQEQITVSGDTVGDVLENFFEQYNNTLQTLAEQKRIDQPDEYEFARSESASAIINAKIPYDQQSASSNVLNISNVEAGPPNRSGRMISVPRGTSIQAFIEALVRESEFYRSQFDQDGQPIAKNKFLQALRTKTRLEILSTTGGGGGNRPRYKFFWILRPFKVSENYFKKDAQTGDMSNVLPVREYNYLYTGKNKDILDFNVIYRFGFYQAIPYLKQSGEGQSNDAVSGESPGEEVEEDTTGQTGIGTSQVTTEATRTSKDGFIADLNTVNGEVATIFEQVIQDPSADLLVTQMEILGDPVWIEQKSVLNESYQDSYLEDSPCIDRFGAVTTDEYEVYVKVNFKTPTDLDDTTGLFKIADAAFFEGQYKVFICESRFAGGLFTNVLQMVRMRHQPTDAERESISEQTTTGNYLGETSDTAGQDVDASNTTGNVSLGIGAEFQGGPDFLDRLPVPRITIETIGNRNRVNPRIPNN